VQRSVEHLDPDFAVALSHPYQPAGRPLPDASRYGDQHRWRKVRAPWKQGGG